MGYISLRFRAAFAQNETAINIQISHSKKYKRLQVQKINLLKFDNYKKQANTQI